MRTLYNAALLPVRVASLVFGAWPRSTPEAELERDQRLARRLPDIPPDALWIHGASVGESRLVGALAAAIRTLRPAQPLAASAVTPAGRAQLPAKPAVDGAFFLPLDFPSVQRRAFDALRPSTIVLVETELWPNLLAEAERRGIPVAVVNGRLSPERFLRYRRLRRLYRPLLRNLAAVAAAGADDALRFAELGVPGTVLHTFGNLKFDLQQPPVDAAALRARFGIAGDRPVVAAGSTGDGEDGLVLDAFLEARREVPSLLLILAPRHAPRFDAAAGEAARRGLAVARVSRGATAAAADVLLVDTIGQLATLYALAGSAFVGGSLVPVGGHNLLEPVVAGVPAIFGPHTHHVGEVAEALLAAGAGERVANVPALAARWTAFAKDPELRARFVRAGQTFLAANQGALQRTAELVLAIRDRS